MNLSELKAGEKAVLSEIGGQGALRQHFLDMGLIPGTEITYVKAAPMGDPVEFRVWDYELTLRLSEAEQIVITRVESVSGEERHEQQKALKPNDSRHPGLGEMGIYHVKKRGETIEKGELLTFGLAGNQNCGKTRSLTS
jgi:ferrous iron transport protein B